MATEDIVWSSNRSHSLQAALFSILMIAAGWVGNQPVLIVTAAALVLMFTSALLRRPRIELRGSTFTVVTGRSLRRTSFDLAEVARVEVVESIAAATLNPLLPPSERAPHIVRFHLTDRRVVDYGDGVSNMTEDGVVRDITARTRASSGAS